MNPVQYIILNKSLGMSTGKAAAQAAHASVEGVRISAKTPGGNPWDSSIVNRWYRGGHYCKIILEVEDAAALQVARQYIEARGFKTSLIIDEGRTEVEPMSVTALGCEIVDKDWPHARETFSAFKLYSDKLPQFNFVDASAREELLSSLKGYHAPSQPGWLQRAASRMNAKAARIELENKIKKEMREGKPTILP